MLSSKTPPVKTKIHNRGDLCGSFHSPAIVLIVLFTIVFEHLCWMCVCVCICTITIATELSTHHQPHTRLLFYEEIQYKHSRAGTGCPSYYYQYHPFTARLALLLDHTGLSSGTFKRLFDNSHTTAFVSLVQSFINDSRKIMEISLVILCSVFLLIVL